MWLEKKRRGAAECVHHVCTTLWRLLGFISEQTHSNMYLFYMIKKQNVVGGDFICTFVLQ